MLNLPPSVRVFVARGATDLRKAYNGLAALAENVIQQDPQSGHLFLFLNRRRNLLKVLWWDRSGYILLCKRLEHGQFAIFDQASGTRDAYELKVDELALLMQGIDLRGARRRPSHDDLFPSARTTD